MPLCFYYPLSGDFLPYFQGFTNDYLICEDVCSHPTLEAKNWPLFSGGKDRVYRD